MGGALFWRSIPASNPKSTGCQTCTQMVWALTVLLITMDTSLQHQKRYPMKRNLHHTLILITSDWHYKVIFMHQAHSTSYVATRWQMTLWKPSKLLRHVELFLDLKTKEEYDQKAYFQRNVLRWCQWLDSAATYLHQSSQLDREGRRISLLSCASESEKNTLIKAGWTEARPEAESQQAGP
ncbi:uncharacterized protein ACBT44_013212 [Syngnathus typhle]